MIKIDKLILQHLLKPNTNLGLTHYMAKRITNCNCVKGNLSNHRNFLNSKIMMKRTKNKIKKNVALKLYSWQHLPFEKETWAEFN